MSSPLKKTLFNSTMEKSYRYRFYAYELETCMWYSGTLRNSDSGRNLIVLEESGCLSCEDYTVIQLKSTRRDGLSCLPFF